MAERERWQAALDGASSAKDLRSVALLRCNLAVDAVRRGVSPPAQGLSQLEQLHGLVHPLPLTVVANEAVLHARLGRPLAVVDALLRAVHEHAASGSRALHGDVPEERLAAYRLCVLAVEACLERGRAEVARDVVLPLLDGLLPLLQRDAKDAAAAVPAPAAAAQPYSPKSGSEVKGLVRQSEHVARAVASGELRLHCFHARVIMALHGYPEAGDVRVRLEEHVSAALALRRGERDRSVLLVLAQLHACKQQWADAEALIAQAGQEAAGEGPWAANNRACVELMRGRPTVAAGLLHLAASQSMASGRIAPAILWNGGVAGMARRDFALAVDCLDRLVPDAVGEVHGQDWAAVSPTFWHRLSQAALLLADERARAVHAGNCRSPLIRSVVGTRAQRRLVIAQRDDDAERVLDPTLGPLQRLGLGMGRLAGAKYPRALLTGAYCALMGGDATRAVELCATLATHGDARPADVLLARIYTAEALAQLGQLAIAAQHLEAAAAMAAEQQHAVDVVATNRAVVALLAGNLDAAQTRLDSLPADCVLPEAALAAVYTHLRAGRTDAARAVLVRGGVRAV